MKTLTIEPWCVAGGIAAVVPLCACVDLPELGNESGTEAGAPVLVVSDPPPDDPLFVAPIVQFMLRSAESSSEPLAAVVVRGELAERDLSALAANTPSGSLQKRVVPSRSWLNLQGELVVAPSIEFDSGERISVAVPSLGWTQAWTVAEDDTPRLRRIWPIAADGAWAGHAVFCEASPATGWASASSSEVRWGPDGTSGTLRAGALDGFGAGCVHWEAENGTIPEALYPPPRAMLEDGRWARIEPEAITGRVTGEPIEPEGTCDAGLTTLGPVCARVQDDRILLFGNSNPALIGIEIAGQRTSGVPGNSEPMLLRGMDPDTPYGGMVVFLDKWGRRFEGSFAVHTGEVEPHVVINEVMANPAGAEPAQEWVELYNDGRTAVNLAGWHLEDVGLAAELPSFVLGPGQYALVVNDGYDAAGWADRPPLEGTRLIRVAHLGKSGLSNSGEPLRLLRSDDTVVSAVPAIPSPQQSVSVARIAPDAWDSPASFAAGRDGGTPGSPNTPQP